ncbi:ATP-binding protein [Streptomyces griseoluteus]|uniref:ATP-binding protein n=1 Tax=Streptomyces griseoluteus TaxID=29306 RepID=A0A4Z1DR95_STRGP|nr:ATP-binding protein [Streptomyces griseoluteus]TGN85997.1 ATP-binding protein [Streptomyces griseoluteus]
MASVIPSAPLGTDSAADRSRPGAAPAPATAGAGRRFRFELAAHPGSPAQARRLARTRLAGWSVCADTCESAVLVVSELVTNAVVHTASSRVVCELADHDGLVRIAVRDEGCAPGEPHPAQQRPDEEHGRGLLLVAALCRAWGAQEYGPGLLVWAELDRGPAADGHSDAPAHTGTRVGTRATEPRHDLGWGTRGKPDPSRAPGEDVRSAPGRHIRVPEQYAPAAEPAEVRSRS